MLKIGLTRAVVPLKRNPGTRGKAVLSAACAAALLAVQGAAAQDAGSFRFLQSVVHDYDVIDHAGGPVTGGPLVGTNTVLESSGPPFVEGETSVARCLALTRALPNGIVELEAPCTLTDGAGDQVHLLARRRDGDVTEGGGGAGRFEIMGGTGKYAGVSGECPYSTRYLPGNHAVTFSRCTWQKP